MPIPATPFELLAATNPVGRASKTRLLAISRSIEARALAAPTRATLYICLQSREFFTTRTARIHQRLVERGATVHLFGNGVTDPDVLAGGHCHHLPWDDPLAAEWNVLLLSDGAGWALAAREVDESRGAPDGERVFDWLVTAVGPRIAVAADSLLGRLAPA
ncbi:MAG: DICT sensory domain-containing protein [Jatrophihabitans sp.]|uniref:DICT sensory domain-containing protein n=1 Tax=Jatrophihabitans sp. TaxID=1932789 RepID=UPI003F80552F